MILWNVSIQCDHAIEARRHDKVIFNREDKNYFIVAITIPGDSRLSEKQGEKSKRYQDLKREIMRMGNLKSSHVIPINVGVTRKLGNWVG